MTKCNLQLIKALEERNIARRNYQKVVTLKKMELQSQWYRIQEYEDKLFHFFDTKEHLDSFNDFIETELVKDEAFQKVLKEYDEKEKAYSDCLKNVAQNCNHLNLTQHILQE